MDSYYWQERYERYEDERIAEQLLDRDQYEYYEEENRDVYMS